MHRIYASLQASQINLSADESRMGAAVRHVKDVLHVFGDDLEFRQQFVTKLSPSVIDAYKKSTGANLHDGIRCNL